MNRRTWTVVLGDGVIPGLTNLCFYLALARSPLGIAVTIEFLGPLAVVPAGSRRWLDAFCVVLMAGGAALIQRWVLVAGLAVDASTASIACGRT